MPKSSSRIKLYTEYKHLEKEYKLNREVKTKERIILYNKCVEKESEEMSETKLPYLEQMMKTEKKSSQTTHLEKLI